jgi:hypothetical protein
MNGEPLTCMFIVLETMIALMYRVALICRNHDLAIFGGERQVRARAGGKSPADPCRAPFLPPTLAPSQNRAVGNTKRYRKAQSTSAIAHSVYTVRHEDQKCS